MILLSDRLYIGVTVMLVLAGPLLTSGLPHEVRVQQTINMASHSEKNLGPLGLSSVITRRDTRDGGDRPSDEGDHKHKEDRRNDTINDDGDDGNNANKTECKLMIRAHD